MGTSIMSYIVSMGVYILILLFIVEGVRKYHKTSALIWLLSLLTIPLWIKGGVVGWFRWAKNLSIILPIIIVSTCRISKFENKPGGFWEFFRKGWAIRFAYSILILNIAEATLKDLALGNYFNATCGVLLCVTAPLPGRFWRFSTKDRADLLAYTTIAWNLLYTTWNACFVFAEAGPFFAASLCIISAAALYPLLKKRPELYMMARCQTLAAHIIIRSSFPKLFPRIMNASTWQNPTVLKYWGIANAIIIVPYTVWFFWQHHTDRAGESFVGGGNAVPIEA